MDKIRSVKICGWALQTWQELDKNSENDKNQVNRASEVICAEVFR